jgi:hypothetical protein
VDLKSLRCSEDELRKFENGIGAGGSPDLLTESFHAAVGGPQMEIDGF